MLLEELGSECKADTGGKACADLRGFRSHPSRTPVQCAPCFSLYLCVPLYFCPSVSVYFFTSMSVRLYSCTSVPARSSDHGSLTLPCCRITWTPALGIHFEFLLYVCTLFAQINGNITNLRYGKYVVATGQEFPPRFSYH